MVRSKIVKRLSKTMYLINIGGYSRTAHVNQLKRKVGKQVKFAKFTSFLIEPNKKMSHKRRRSKDESSTSEQEHEESFDELCLRNRRIRKFRRKRQ